MHMTVEYDKGLAQNALEARLIDTEARIGEITDIRAISQNVDGKDVEMTVATYILFKDPGPVLSLKVEGEAAPEGKKLQIAGVAYIDGDENVVKIYR